MIAEDNFDRGRGRVGHAVFIDAAAFYPHLKPCDYPGIGLNHHALDRDNLIWINENIFSSF
jgi:tryptophanase